MKCCQNCAIFTPCLNSLRNRLLIFKPSPTKGVGRTTPTLPTSHAPPRLSQLLGEPCSTINPWSFCIHQQKLQERRDKSITKYEPADKISARSNGEQSVGRGQKLLSETFSLYSFLSLSFLLTAVTLFEKTLKVNIGLGLHIGSEPNPTPATGAFWCIPSLFIGLFISAPI